MKKAAILLGLGMFLAVSCEKGEQEHQVSNVSFTPCQQTKATSNELTDRVDVEFTDKGVKITYCNFEVTCDFTIVNVTHTFVNGVLNISQESSPNLANCVCNTDVSYTIDGISKDKVNVIFINGKQVYCHNEKPVSANQIIATEVENITSDVKGVFAQLLYNLWSNNDNYWYTAGLQYLYNEGTYQNGSFEIKFPNSFPAEFLGPFYPDYTLSSDDEVTISDINAKTGIIYLHASTDHYGIVTKNYSPVGMFELVGDEWIADYMYSDRSFTVKGISKSGLEFDCSFNKGWNIMYSKIYFSKITTKKPSNENFKWYFRKR